METLELINLGLEVLSFVGGSAVLSAVIPAKTKSAHPVYWPNP